MRKLLTGLVLTVGLAGLAQAADPSAGGEIAQNQCVSCHGQNGVEPLQPNYARLAGLGEDYLFKQLSAIKSGDRNVPEMMGIVRGLDEQDMRNLAAYYNQQEMPRGEANPEKVDAGESLYRGGDLSRDVAACIACHGPKGLGNEPAGYPRLSGQSAEYVVKSLKDYRSGERVYNAQSQIMGDIASKLNDDEISAVAEYIEGLY
ncbi:MULTISPECIES: c-type cytochrome [Gammaproteobacteria]|jgi:cytochrome c553|uniref:C-type cytochrome n=1 Tax=Vreelandella halophila TaxID=86177 RepID=A0A9X4YCU4_9GAMM|nr:MULTISPECIES: c-type cytochrome [Gammaproteobacteria]KAA8983481.1 cytochrome c4 [Halospina sp. K52047b]MYL27166.1 c-type cytochrome [Halomonas utahensis]MYL74368.1 c-type cytochrome [Halomonas sp. 22501_18_FS]